MNTLVKTLCKIFIFFLELIARPRIPTAVGPVFNRKDGSKRPSTESGMIVLLGIIIIRFVLKLVFGIISMIFRKRVTQ